MTSATPEEFLCPITLLIMTDPVVGSDGRTYERAAITHWLRSNPLSPLTRQPMTIQSLKPNFALRSAIERYRATPTATPPPPRQQQQTQYPQPAYTPIPVQPSAPPGDVYYAMQVYQQDLNQQLLPRPTVTITDPGLDVRRRKAFLSCVCLIVGILIIVLIAKIITSD